MPSCASVVAALICSSRIRQSTQCPTMTTKAMATRRTCGIMKKSMLFPEKSRLVHFCIRPNQTESIYFCELCLDSWGKPEAFSQWEMIYYFSCSGFHQEQRLTNEWVKLNSQFTSVNLSLPLFRLSLKVVDVQCLCLRCNLWWLVTRVGC